MPENHTVTTEIVDALKQTTTEAKQLEAIFGKLLQVLTQNGFQVSVDIVGIIQNMYNRLEKAEKQTQGVGRQLEQLDELLRTFTLITSSLELDHVLEDVMDTVIRLTGAERAYLMLSDKDTGELNLSVARNWDKENIADSEAVFSRSIVNQALSEGQAILATNAQADDRFQGVKSIVSNNLRSILCIPLTLQGRVIGALYADNRITQDVFRHEQIPLLTAFGTQAAIAIENARQFGAVKNDLNKALTELKSLQIELDRGHVEKQVSEITESDYFQRLSVSARSMRQRGEKADEEAELAVVKKTGLLNQPLSAMIAGLGHADTVVITDAGLSIPANIQRIDLAVSAGVPGFLDVVRAMLGEMQISSAIVASELAEHSPQFHAAIIALLDDVLLIDVPHSEFLSRSRSARAAVRTGEFTPFANIILVSEVIF